MKVKERWGGGRGPDSSAPWPGGLGQAPSPRPQRLSLFRGSGEATPEAPGRKGWALAAAEAAGSGTSQTALVSSEPRRLQARVPSRPRSPQLPPPSPSASSGAPGRCAGRPGHTRGGAPWRAAAGTRRAGPRRGYPGVGAGPHRGWDAAGGPSAGPGPRGSSPLHAAQRAGAAAASWGRGSRGSRGSRGRTGAWGRRPRLGSGAPAEPVVRARTARAGRAGCGTRSGKRGWKRRGRGAGAEAGTPGSGGGAGLRGGGGAGPSSGGCGGRGGGGGPCDRLRPVLETKGAAAAGAGRARRGRERSTAGSERDAAPRLPPPRPPHPAGAPRRGGQKERQSEKGRPGERVRRVDLGALHPQQQGLRRGFPRGDLRGPDPAHPVPGALQLEEGVRSGLQVQV